MWWKLFGRCRRCFAFSPSHCSIFLYLLQIQNGGTPDLPSAGMGPDSIGYPYSNNSIMSKLWHSVCVCVLFIYIYIYIYITDTNNRKKKTHTHIYIYIYIYVCVFFCIVCLCVCVS